MRSPRTRAAHSRCSAVHAFPCSHYHVRTPFWVWRSTLFAFSSCSFLQGAFSCLSIPFLVPIPSWVGTPVPAQTHMIPSTTCCGWSASRCVRTLEVSGACPAHSHTATTQTFPCFNFPVHSCGACCERMLFFLPAAVLSACLCPGKRRAEKQ